MKSSTALVLLEASRSWPNSRSAPATRAALAAPADLATLANIAALAAPADPQINTAPMSVDEDTDVTKDFVNDPRDLLSLPLKRARATELHARVSKKTKGKATLENLRRLTQELQRARAAELHASVSKKTKGKATLENLLQLKRGLHGKSTEEKPDVTALEPPSIQMKLG